MCIILSVYSYIKCSWKSIKQVSSCSCWHYRSYKQSFPHQPLEFLLTLIRQKTAFLNSQILKFTDLPLIVTQHWQCRLDHINSDMFSFVKLVCLKKIICFWPYIHSIQEVFLGGFCGVFFLNLQKCCAFLQKTTWIVGKLDHLAALISSDASVQRNCCMWERALLFCKKWARRLPFPSLFMTTCRRFLMTTLAVIALQAQVCVFY